jgi:aryl-alcohol dehydrogenase-like predicted oxidoreductase
MEYRLLGRSGLRVSELALGAMTFGSEGFGVEKGESRQVYDAFREAGGNFIDTANGYAGGRSEEFLGEFLADDRDRVVLATKFTIPMRSRDVNAGTNNRKNMMESVEASLRRLRTDFIDLYWVHAWDALTPTEELMRGLDDLVRAGKVRYVGISDTPAWVVSRANTLAELRGWTPFVGLQIPFSLIERTVERELLPMAKALGITVTPWGAVGSGVLTGKYNRDPKAKGRAAASGRVTERAIEIAGAVVEIADEIGRTPAQVALNWVRQADAEIVPLVGARVAEQLRENLGCLEFSLDDRAMRRLNEVSRIELGFPRDFLEERFRSRRRPRQPEARA